LTYRVGIIGTGRIAGSIDDEVAKLPLTFLLPYSHAGAYAQVSSTRIVAAADPSADRLHAFAERWHVPATYPDYRTMLAQEQLDIVSVCTPTSTHVSIGMDLVASGVRAVFMEKPLAESLADADRFVDAVRSSGTVVAVNHFRTYDPYYRKVRQLIAEGAIGDVHSVTARWAEGMLFGGTHLFDTLRFLTGAEAEWVFARLDAGDGVFDRGGTGMMRLSGGADVFIDNAVGNSVVCEFDIVGTRGRLRIGNSLFPEFYTLDPECSMALTKRPFPAAVMARSAMTVAVEELVRALETGQRPGSDVHSARSDLELCVAFHLADQTGGVVTLPIAQVDYSITDSWGRYA